MEKGTFAKHKNKIYMVSNFDNEKIRLQSSDKIDLDMGFSKKAYPDYYKNAENLPTIYIKEIDTTEADEIFEIEYTAIYKGSEFNLHFNKQNTQFWIGTPNAKLAEANGLERTDKYYYEKRVEKNEIQITEIKKEQKLKESN